MSEQRLKELQEERDKLEKRVEYLRGITSPSNEQVKELKETQNAYYLIGPKIDIEMWNLDKIKMATLSGKRLPARKRGVRAPPIGGVKTIYTGDISDQEKGLRIPTESEIAKMYPGLIIPKRIPHKKWKPTPPIGGKKDISPEELSDLDRALRISVGTEYYKYPSIHKVTRTRKSKSRKARRSRKSKSRSTRKSKSRKVRRSRKSKSRKVRRSRKSKSRKVRRSRKSKSRKVRKSKSRSTRKVRRSRKSKSRKVRRSRKSKM